MCPNTCLTSGPAHLDLPTFGGHPRRGALREVMVKILPQENLATQLSQVEARVFSKAFGKCSQMPRSVTSVPGMDRAQQCLGVVPRLVRSKIRISISHLTEFLLYIQYMYAENRIRMGTAQSCFQSNQA